MFWSKIKISGFFFLSLLLGLLLPFAAAAENNGAVMGGKISVHGEAELTVTPDLVQIDLGVVTTEKTAAAAQQANAKLMDRVVTKLQAMGIAPADLKTRSFSLEPQYTYDKEQGEQKLTGYRASNQLTVTLRDDDLQKAGQVIDAAIAAGANQVQSVTYSVADPTLHQLEALRQATLNARRKAEAIATAAGVKIKRITTINDNTVVILPYRERGAQFLTAGTKAAPSTPLVPGDVQIRADVAMELLFK